MTDPAKARSDVKPSVPSRTKKRLEKRIISALERVAAIPIQDSHEA
jgi:hypothetical protein